MPCGWPDNFSIFMAKHAVGYLAASQTGCCCHTLRTDPETQKFVIISSTIDTKIWHGFQKNAEFCVVFFCDYLMD